MNILVAAGLGILVGIGAAFTGLGGGFLIVPMLLLAGFTAQKAVGTSFMAIVMIAASALFAHARLDNVDYKVGIIIGLGGLIGAQLGGRLLDQVSPGTVQKAIAVMLMGLAIYLFLKK